MDTFEIITQPIESNAAKVFINGSLTTQNLVDIKDQLIVLLQDFDELEVIVDHFDEFDISCIQIFYALSKSASHLDKKITYHVDLPEQIADILSHSGFKNLLVPKAEFN